MRGQRLYVFRAEMSNGKKYEVEFWSHQRKGSIENFCDGLSRLQMVYEEVKELKVEHWEISYAQTSLSRR